MTLEASGESCFKPVYCSEMCPHAGSALQCSAAIFIHQVGATTVGRHQLWPPVGPKSPVPVQRDTCHRLAGAASASVLPQAAGRPWPRGPVTPAAPGTGLAPPWSHVLAPTLSFSWPCPTEAVTALRSHKKRLRRQQNHLPLPGFSCHCLLPTRCTCRERSGRSAHPSPASVRQSALTASHAGTTSSSLSRSQ